MIEVCIICGHEKKEHFIGPMSGYPICSLCADLSMFTEETHEFKLDNLRFVEDLAEERKLI
jgi:hypothetical protein